MLVEREMDAVIRVGLFRDREHILHEAMTALFATRPILRTEAAVELFRSGDVSLLRAAEMAGLDFESFRRLLQDRGIAWEIEAGSPDEMDRNFRDFLAGTAP